MKRHVVNYWKNLTDNYRRPVELASASMSYDSALYQYVSMKASPTVKKNNTNNDIKLHCLYESSRIFNQPHCYYDEPEEENSTNYKPNSKEEEWHLRGIEHLKTESISPAMRYYELIVSHCPQDLLAIFNLQSLYLTHLCNNHAALNVVAAALPNWSVNTKCYAQLMAMYARGFHAVGNYSRAIDVARLAISMDSLNGIAYETLVLSHTDAGEYNVAASFLKNNRQCWEHGELPLVEYKMYGHSIKSELFESGDSRSVMSHLERNILPQDLKNFSEETLTLASEIAIELFFIQDEVTEFESGNIFERIYEEFGYKKLTSPESRIMAHAIAIILKKPFKRIVVAGHENKSADDFLHTTTSSTMMMNIGDIKDNTSDFQNAMEAFLTKDYATVVDILSTLQSDNLPRFYKNVLLSACIKSEQFRLAKHLLFIETTLNPNSGLNWHKLSLVLEAMGEDYSDAKMSAYTLGYNQRGHSAA